MIIGHYTSYGFWKLRTPPLGQHQQHWLRGGVHVSGQYNDPKWIILRAAQIASIHSTLVFVSLKYIFGLKQRTLFFSAPKYSVSRETT